MSVLVHGFLLLAVNGGTCRVSFIPCVDLGIVLSVFQLEGSSDYASLEVISANLEQFYIYILAYLLISIALGFAIGSLLGRGIVLDWNPFGKFRFRNLARHDWVYRLIQPDSNPMAYVLTNAKSGDSYIIYKGLVRSFGLGSDGKFTYLLLRGSERSTVDFGSGGQATPQGNTRFRRVGPSSSGWTVTDEDRLLLLDGSMILNTYFEPARTYTVSEDAQQERRAIREALTILSEAFKAYPEEGTEAQSP